MKLVSSSNRTKKHNNVISRSNNSHLRTDAYRNNDDNINDKVIRNKRVYQSAPVTRSASVPQESNAERPDSHKKPVSKKKNHIRTAIVIVLIITFGVFALFLSLGFYVRSLDTVFPNVWAEGANVSGKTLEEAALTLINEGYERNAEGISVTIVFPDESEFSVSGEQVGLSMDAGEAAIAAFTFGREGTLINNTLTYISSLFNRTDLYDLSSAKFDDSVVRELAAEYTALFNDTLFDNNLEVNEDNITIVKGTAFKNADGNEVYELAISTLMNAVEENEHKTAKYIPGDTTDEEIDLLKLYDHIHVLPVDSWFDIETLSATQSSEGRTFDLDSAQDMLLNATHGSTIVIPILILEPEYTQEDIESMIFRDVIAESTTTIAGTSNRLSNITLAAKFMDETVVNPGEVFSFNEVVGERTSERGFLMAGVFIGGRLQDGIGGGICQASSTLYDAVLHTNLEVVERHPHGFIVSYLPYGNDSTVYFGRLDFKFKNNMDFPLRVESTINGREITVKLIGTKPDDTYIKTETVTISTTPFGVEERDDPELPLGHTEVYTPGITGHVVDTYKVVYSADDVEIDRILVGRTTYRVQQRVILHGTYYEPEPNYEPPADEQQPVEGG